MSPRIYQRGGVEPQAGPKPIPSGKYLMEIVSAVFGKSKSSGNDMVTIHASPVEGEFKGKKIRNYVVMFPKGHPNLGMTLHFLKTIGEPWQGPEGDEDSYEVEETRWIGRRFWAIVDSEMFNGESQNKIKKFIPIEEAQPIGPAKEEEIPF